MTRAELIKDMDKHKLSYYGNMVDYILKREEVLMSEKRTENFQAFVDWQKQVNSRLAALEQHNKETKDGEIKDTPKD